MKEWTIILDTIKIDAFYYEIYCEIFDDGIYVKLTRAEEAEKIKDVYEHDLCNVFHIAASSAGIIEYPYYLSGDFPVKEIENRLIKFVKKMGAFL